MLCVMAAICSVSADIFVMVSMVVCISSACLSMSAMRSWLYFWFMVWLVPCMLIWNGIDVCSIGLPSGRVIACTREMPGTAEDGLGDLVDDQEVGRVAQIVIALDQQQFGIHPGGGKCRSAAA